MTDSERLQDSIARATHAAGGIDLTTDPDPIAAEPRPQTRRRRMLRLAHIIAGYFGCRLADMRGETLGEVLDELESGSTHITINWTRFDDDLLNMTI